jgi:hypothetical protein
MLLLAGCGVLKTSPASIVVPASFTDRDCDAIARQRRADAVVNGFDAATGDRIFQDSYANCLSLKSSATFKS